MAPEVGDVVAEKLLATFHQQGQAGQATREAEPGEWHRMWTGPLTRLARIRFV